MLSHPESIAILLGMSWNSHMCVTGIFQIEREECAAQHRKIERESKQRRSTKMQAETQVVFSNSTKDEHDTKASDSNRPSTLVGVALIKRLVHSVLLDLKL